MYQLKFLLKHFVPRRSHLLVSLKIQVIKFIEIQAIESLKVAQNSPQQLDLDWSL